jgi:hypothetical protein
MATARHVRFALRDVTFEGVPLPGATMDCWMDARGVSQWSARVVARFGPIETEGTLSGTMADGRVLTGHVVVADKQVGDGGRRETMIEFHGSGPLEGLVPPAEPPPDVSAPG